MVSDVISATGNYILILGFILHEAIKKHLVLPYPVLNFDNSYVEGTGKPRS